MDMKRIISALMLGGVILTGCATSNGTEKYSTPVFQTGGVRF